MILLWCDALDVLRLDWWDEPGRENMLTCWLHMQNCEICGEIRRAINESTGS